jgi:AraC-like DNA-binding protein
MSETTITIVPVNILHFMYVAIAIFSILLVFGEKRFKALLLLLVAHVIIEVFNIVEELHLFSELPLVTPAITLAIGPLYYLFAKNLIYGDLELKNHLFHFLPAFIGLGFTYWWSELLQVAFVILLIYFFLTFRLLQHYHKILVEITADSESHALNWLTKTFVVVGIIELINFIRLNLQLKVSYEVFVNWYFLSELFSLLITVYLTFKAIRHPQLFTGISEFENIITVKKNQSSNDLISELEQARSIFAGINKHLEQSFAYRQAKYSLRQLAGEMGLTDQMISWSINQGGEQSFSDYINSLRLEEVKCSLRDKSRQNSILDIAFEAGFSSKSTFNAVFKQFVGVTPSQYIKQYQ